MQGFYILLVIAGIICVVLSFIVSEKIDGMRNGTEVEFSEEMLTLLLKKSEKLVDASMQSYLENNNEEMMEDTKIELNRLCNEKIMAVDEFSDTVLEKINQNHSEVIFLYNMLNEKEEELKKLLAEVNIAAKDANVGNVNAGTSEAKASKSEKHSSSKTTSKKEKNQPKQAVNEEERKVMEGLTKTQKQREANTREDILSMYKKGESVTDIAQKLKMGKGEVKLIIDLYQGAKK